MPLVALLALVGCTPEEQPPPNPLTPNIMVVLIDDLGVDSLRMYGVSEDAPPTPTLDALAARGVVFNNAYASPVCSTTRAGLLTGRWGVQTGIGKAHSLPPPEGTGLPDDEVILPEALDLGTGNTYDHAMVGKWHLHDQILPEGAFHPVTAGFNAYAGNQDNTGKRILDDGRWENPFHYWKAQDDTTFVSDGKFITSDEIDDALGYTETLQEPWFLYLAPHATHDPWHPPPPPLNPYGIGWGNSKRDLYYANLMALDLELGRLFAEMNQALLQRTYIIVIGDNGTPGSVSSGMYEGLPSKGTCYENGIHVPLIVAGPGALRREGESDQLVSHQDIFATVLELAGAEYPLPEGSVSFAGALNWRYPDQERESVYLDRFDPNVSGQRTLWWRAARDERFKLLRFTDGFEQMFDLSLDRVETYDLLALQEGLNDSQQASYDRLSDHMARVEAADEWVDTP